MINLKNVKSYIISIVIALLVGGISAFLTSGNMNIYKELITPPLSPPGILFPIVWTILYVLMGISSALIYNENRNDKKKALFTYGISLFFNFTWSLIFFNMRNFFFAFIWIIFLFVSILQTIIEYFRINKIAAYLQIPYLLWVAFAGYLNLGIWILNL